MRIESRAGGCGWVRVGDEVAWRLGGDSGVVGSEEEAESGVGEEREERMVKRVGEGKAQKNKSQSPLIPFRSQQTKGIVCTGAFGPDLCDMLLLYK